MRLGMLGKTDLNMNGHGLQSQISMNETTRATTGEIPASAQNQFAWFPSGLHMSVAEHQSISLETSRTHKDASQDDASSDSSSSSSSDSQ